jgi:adenine-specific DNA methylase
MLEDIPRHGPKLAKELRRVGAEIKAKAERELAEFYPKDPDGAIPIAYLWARTVQCESPNCGVEIPIYRSPWLCKKGADRARYFKENSTGRCVVLLIENAPRGGPISFRIAQGHGSEEPRAGYDQLAGTKTTGNNANVRCPCCGAILSGSKKNPRVPTQLTKQSGGSNVIFDSSGTRIGGAFLLAVVVKSITGSKEYRLPRKEDYEAVFKAAHAIDRWREESEEALKPPDEPLPPAGTLGFRIQRYGMRKWRDLFTKRQQVALLTFARLIRHESQSIISRPLAAVLGRCADYWSSGVIWAQTGEFVAHTFGRQALPLV